MSWSRSPLPHFYNAACQSVASKRIIIPWKKSNHLHKITCLKCNTHLADPLLLFHARRPVLMCQAYRRICIHPHPWKPCHCFCRAGSGRGRSQTCTALWPCEGRASSPRHTEPPLPALKGAAAAPTRVGGIRFRYQVSDKKCKVVFFNKMTH